MSGRKERIDEALLRRGLVSDKERARRLIMAGSVLVDDQVVDKAGTKIAEDAAIRLRVKQSEFASRAGGKLAAALKVFPMDVKDRICLDLGASTGGFTDCLLQAGAAKVFAVDVGTNQLLYRLRTHEAVVSLERTHARDLDRKMIPDDIARVVVDVSFTSLRYVLPPVLNLVGPDARGILLFKPQFEVARDLVKTGGMVDEADAQGALAAFKLWLQEQQIELLGEMKSPVKGRDGNQEYLLYVALKPTK